MQETQE
jgi:hypothetical protein